MRKVFFTFLLLTVESTGFSQPFAHFMQIPLDSSLMGQECEGQGFEIAAPICEKKPEVTVFGYLPYWNFCTGSLKIQFDCLHVIAYFGTTVDAQGNLGALKDFGTPAMDYLIEVARSYGVKVVLVVGNFDSNSLATLLSSPSARENAVNNIVRTVKAHGGQGVNIDFEGLPYANKQDFVLFIGALREALDTALGEEAHLSIATPAVDWNGSFDYDVLASIADNLFIMGYDYHWRGGQPGPVSPLRSSSKWGKYSLEWTIDDYFHYGADVYRDRLVLGVPLYGYDWPTTGDTVPGTATDKATAVFYKSCQQKFDIYGAVWDEPSSTPYSVYNSNGWHQLFCENRRSLREKFYLALEKGLGGVGFWALGYEGDFREVFEEIRDAFVKENGSGDEVELLPDVADNGLPEMFESEEDAVETSLAEDLHVVADGDQGVDTDESRDVQVWSWDRHIPTKDDNPEANEFNFNAVDVQRENVNLATSGSGCNLGVNPSTCTALCFALLLAVCLILGRKTKKGGGVYGS
jgi:spore germination protein YaaH